MEKGEIIQLEYDGWIAGTNELFDTTNEELAKAQKAHDEEKKYGPISTIVGAGRLIPGLEEELLKAEMDKDYEVTIPPEKAYGAYNPDDVETFSEMKLARLRIEPAPGKTVVINNRQGHISGMFTGRIRVDFNHRLAGKTLRYRFKVVGKAGTPESRVRAIIAMTYGHEGEFQLSFDTSDALTLTLPDVCKYDPNWTLGKLRLVGDLREQAGLRTVVFREVYVKKEAEAEKKAEAPEGEAKAGAELEHVDESVPQKPDEPSGE